MSEEKEKTIEERIEINQRVIFEKLKKVHSIQMFFLAITLIGLFSGIVVWATIAGKM